MKSLIRIPSIPAVLVLTVWMCCTTRSDREPVPESQAYRPVAWSDTTDIAAALEHDFEAGALHLRRELTAMRRDAGEWLEQTRRDVTRVDPEQEQAVLALIERLRMLSGDLKPLGRAPESERLMELPLFASSWREVRETVRRRQKQFGRKNIADEP